MTYLKTFITFNYNTQATHKKIPKKTQKTTTISHPVTINSSYKVL